MIIVAIENWKMGVWPLSLTFSCLHSSFSEMAQAKRKGLRGQNNSGAKHSFNRFLHFIVNQSKSYFTTSVAPCDANFCVKIDDHVTVNIGICSL